MRQAIGASMATFIAKPPARTNPPDGDQRVRTFGHSPAGLPWPWVHRGPGRHFNHLGGSAGIPGASLPHSLITWAVSINARSGTRGRRRRDLVTAFHDADEIIGLPVASYAAVAVIGDALRATT